MPRNDYESLKWWASNLIQNYFLQRVTIDSRFSRFIVKLRLGGIRITKVYSRNEKMHDGILNFRQISIAVFLISRG